MTTTTTVNANNDAAEAEELASLLDRAAVDASVLKAKLMHSKNLSYTEKTQVTKKLFDTILKEEGMLPPQPDLPSATELAAQLTKEKETRARLEQQLQEATAYSRTLEAQIRDLRKQNEALTKARDEKTEKSDRHEKSQAVPSLSLAAASPPTTRVSPRSSVAFSSPPNVASQSTSSSPALITAAQAAGQTVPQTPRRKTVLMGSSSGGTFGEPLGELLGAAQDVPLFVSLATACLEVSATGVLDLFVRSAEKTQVADLRKAVQSGRYDLGSAEPHAVADLLIVFLDELPTPLISSSLVPLLAEAAAIGDASRRASALRSVIWTAPATARTVLLHFFGFFHYLTTRAARISPKDIVRIAGPALLGSQRKKTEVNLALVSGALSALEMVVAEGEKLLSWSAANVQLDKTDSSLRVSAATAEALLVLAADAFYGLADHDLADVVIATHGYFTAPGPLLQALKDAIRVKGGDAWQRRTRLFALSALKRWLQGHRRVFKREKSLLKDAKSIVSHFKPDGEAEEDVLRALISLTSSSGVSFEGGSGTSGSELLAKRRVLTQKVELAAYKASDIAAQLTLIDWAMLREISSEELLHKNYTQAERRYAGGGGGSARKGVSHSLQTRIVQTLPRWLISLIDGRS